MSRAAPRAFQRARGSQRGLTLVELSLNRSWRIVSFDMQLDQVAHVTEEIQAFDDDCIEFCPADFSHILAVTAPQPHAVPYESIVGVSDGVTEIAVECFIEGIGQIMKAKIIGVSH